MTRRNGRSAAATFEGEFSDVTTSYAGKGEVRYRRGKTAGATKMKWENRFEPLDPGDPLGWADQLDDLGEEGWELVAIMPPNAIYKWPIAALKRPENSN
jgi:hypothetical protein